MRRALLLVSFAAGVAAAGGAGAQPARARGVDVQLAQGFGESRLRLAWPVREAGPDRTGVELVLKLHTLRDAAAGAPRREGTEPAVQLELLRPMAGWSAFGHAGWRDSPELPGVAPRRQRWYAQLGASQWVTPRLELGAQLDARQGRITGAWLREASAWAAVQDGAWRWQLALTHGFAAATVAADTGVELTLRASF